MTQCNWCRLADIRHTARRKQRKVTVLPSPEGVDVFVHPQGERPPEGFRHTQGATTGFDRFWRLTLGPVGERCEC